MDFIGNLDHHSSFGQWFIASLKYLTGRDDPLTLGVGWMFFFPFPCVVKFQTGPLGLETNTPSNGKLVMECGNIIGLPDRIF